MCTADAVLNLNPFKTLLLPSDCLVVLLAGMNASPFPFDSPGFNFSGRHAHAQETQAKIGAIFGIFFVSLFAVSFPTVSQRSSLLRIPHVAFFIGKHLGTGVILSTAFCHLLQDSFEHLQNPTLKKEYPGVGKNTGLIILSSLLLIFLVECAPLIIPIEASNSPLQISRHHTAPSRSPSRVRVRPDATESTPLLVPVRPKPSPLTPPYLAAVLAPPRHCPLSRHDGRLLSICVTTANLDPDVAFPPEEDTDVDAGSERHEHDAPKVGRGRQVVGIIVLELGIMLHSLVIGLTLALTTGGDFTSLLTAIVFHQLFEGLSLGIRIASLPAPKTHGRDWFSITLSLLFALTTPVGLAIGMRAFARSAQNLPSTLLVKGVMSAVSAGMLIYAATVEMIAADFVFGNLEDGPGHGHGEGHSHEVEDHGGEGREDPLVWDGARWRWAVCSRAWGAWCSFRWESRRVA
ncbi:Zip-like iron-zinc transporter [Mycena venus]|uniref:Zip-like iron-zinc transporter n=1 Tax=Mycena venus TaxID=2733690 RepID=A0A8H6WUJ8_9AGAR|nr:Zip-like iron-zinc transporter [Mycena venus]